MKKLIHLLLASLLLAGLLLATTAATAAAPYANNRAPLREKPFVKLPLGAIRAEGWLRDQLQRQADGLTGHLDSVYPEVMGPRNGWLGGDGDVWERGPYWIDGCCRCLYPRRQAADRKDPPLGRVGARQPAARRLFRPGGRPSVRKPGHTARQRPRLVAQDGHAQGAATILLGDGRRARHRTDERLFPLPAARASEDPAGALDFLGRTARRATTWASSTGFTTSRATNSCWSWAT